MGASQSQPSGAPKSAAPKDFRLIRGWRDGLKLAWTLTPPAGIAVLMVSQGNAMAALGFGLLTVAGGLSYIADRIIDGWKALYSSLDDWNDHLFAALVKALAGSGSSSVAATTSPPIRDA